MENEETIAETLVEAKESMSKHQFYFDTPMYEVVALTDIEEDFMKGDVDGYNASGGFDTTYTIESNHIGYGDNDYSGFCRILLTCKRKDNDKLRFFVVKGKDFVMKVGQYPSLADIQFAEIGKKYDEVLDTGSLSEFKKAIELAAHGTGVGSFVYLRRIFEGLIFQTFDQHKSTLSIEKKDFAPMWMKDKIDVLKDHLPSQLIEMKSIYSILSKGIHQLGEEECLTYFEPLKLSIELILDQKIELELKRKRDEKVKEELKNIHTKLGKK